MPVSSVPGVSHQLPAIVTLDQTSVVGRVLSSDIVLTEEALSAIVVDKELFVAGALPEGVGSLVAHVDVGLALAQR